MKKNKIALFIIFTLTVCALFASCSESTKYTLYQSYIGDGEAEGIAIEDGYLKKDLDLYMSAKLEAPKPKSDKIDITFLNKEISGTFANESECRVRGQYEYLYNTDNGENFKINEKGELIYWRSSIEDWQQKRKQSESKPVKTIEEIKKICISMLPDSFADGNYEIHIIDPTFPDMEYYLLTFTHTISGFNTNERAVFSLTTSGDLLECNYFDCGRFEGKTVPEDFDKSKLDEIVEGTFADPEQEYNYYHYELTILDDGTLACYAAVHIIEDNRIVSTIGIHIPLE